MRRQILEASAACLLCVLVPPSHAQVTPQPPRVELAPWQQQHRDRVARAAAESLVQYEAWLGFPVPGDATIHSAASSAAVRANGIAVDLPWLAAASTMEIEAQAAYAIAARYWPHEAGAASLVQGLSWYLQGRIVERLFNLQFSQPGHSTEGVRVFGRFIPWDLRTLRVGRAIDARRRGRSAAAFLSLERYLSWPVLQGALRALAADARHAPLTLDRAVAVLGAAAGRDLSWFFDVAFDADATLDYALTGFSSVPGGDACESPGCVRTRVTLARLGDAAFTGTSRTPSGPYEAGQGIVLRVDFADGQDLTAHWDGRAAERTFEFESPVPATFARLDPQGTLVLDPTRTDHTRRATPATNVPIAKWVARWVVWMQDAMLTPSMVM